MSDQESSVVHIARTKGGSAPNPVPHDDDVIDLREYLHQVLRHRWLIAAVAATVTVLTLLQVMTVTPLFEASATLQIDPEESKVLPYEQIGETSGGGSRVLEEYVLTQAKKLEGRALADVVVSNLDLANDPDFTAPTNPGVVLGMAGLLRSVLRAVLIRGHDDGARDSGRYGGKLLKNVQVVPVRDTRLIQVRYRSPSPQLSARVADGIVETFIEQHLQSKFDATIRATEFLREQLDELKIRSERSEEAMLAYARENGIVNVSEQINVSRKKMADLNDALTEAEEAMIEKESLAGAVSRYSGGELPEVLQTDAIRNLKRRLSDVEERLTVLASRHGPQWPEVLQLRDQSDGLRDQIRSEQRRILLSAEGNAEVARDNYERLQASFAQQQQLVARLDEDSIQYRILEREVRSNKELYEGLLQRLKEAGVAAGLRSSNIRLADPATVPRTAISPRRARSVMLSLLLGLGLGVGLAFLLEALDQSIKTAEEVEAFTGIPALGVVPHLGESAKPTRIGRWVPGMRGKDRGDRPLMAFEVGSIRQSQAWEAYRSIRTSLLLSHAGRPPQVIVVTSALPGDGKSTTAVNLAVALAQTGERTLLVDLDLRKPSLAKLFGIASGREEGMSTYLTGGKPRVFQTRFDQLFMIPAGPPAPNPPELLGSDLMARGLAIFRENYTHVIIDAPPCLDLSDALVVSSLADGMLVVVRSEITPRAALTAIAKSIRQAGTNLLGVVVNDLDMSQRGYYYGRYYGGYAPYGSDYGDEDFAAVVGGPQPGPKPRRKR